MSVLRGTDPRVVQKFGYTPSEERDEVVTLYSDTQLGGNGNVFVTPGDPGFLPGSSLETQTTQVWDDTPPRPGTQSTRPLTVSPSLERSYTVSFRGVFVSRSTTRL